jgi:hypothetical protein
MDLSSIHRSTIVDEIDIDRYGMGITKSCERPIVRVFVNLEYSQ